MPLNLFALLDPPGRRIQRFALLTAVQVELTEYLLEQERTFNETGPNEIAFDGKYKPDGDEVLLIDGFADIDNLHAAIQNPVGVPEIDPNPVELSRIKALFSGYTAGDGSRVALLQQFDKRKIISPRGLHLFYSDHVFKKVNGNGVTVDAKLSAILRDDRLLFFSFHAARQIFDLTQYYREATDGDIHNFANLETIHVPNMPAFIAVADTWVRRKVALVQQSRIMEAVPIAELRAIALEFNIALPTRNVDGVESIILPETKVALKQLLRFLDEDYYMSPISRQPHLTNSKRRV